MDQIKIGKFIAERRKDLGYLRKDIAERLGISEIINLSCNRAKTGSNGIKGKCMIKDLFICHGRIEGMRYKVWHTSANLGIIRCL